MRDILKAITTGFLLMVTLSACDKIGEQYKYRPTYDAKPAYIQAIDGINPRPTSNPLVSSDELDDYDMSIRVRRINGAYVSHWKSNPETQNNRILLSPGKTDFVFEIMDFGSGTMFPATFDVVSGQHYKLYIQPKMASVVDSNGKILSEFKYSKGTYYKGLVLPSSH